MQDNSHPIINNVATVLSRKWLNPGYSATESAQASISRGAGRIFEAAIEPEEIRIAGDPNPHLSPPLAERLTTLGEALTDLKRADSLLKEAQKETREAAQALAVLIELLREGRPSASEDHV